MKKTFDIETKMILLKVLLLVLGFQTSFSVVNAGGVGGTCVYGGSAFDTYGWCAENEVTCGICMGAYFEDGGEYPPENSGLCTCDCTVTNQNSSTAMGFEEMAPIGSNVDKTTCSTSGFVTSCAAQAGCTNHCKYKDGCNKSDGILNPTNVLDFARTCGSDNVNGVDDDNDDVISVLSNGCHFGTVKGNCILTVTNCPTGEFDFISLSGNGTILVPEEIRIVTGNDITEYGCLEVHDVRTKMDIITISGNGRAMKGQGLCLQPRESSKKSKSFSWNRSYLTLGLWIFNCFAILSIPIIAYCLFCRNKKRNSGCDSYDDDHDHDNIRPSVGKDHDQTDKTEEDDYGGFDFDENDFDDFSDDNFDDDDDDDDDYDSDSDDNFSDDDDCDTYDYTGYDQYDYDDYDDVEDGRTSICFTTQMNNLMELRSKGILSDKEFRNASRRLTDKFSRKAASSSSSSRGRLACASGGGGGGDNNTRRSSKSPKRRKEQQRQKKRKSRQRSQR